MKAKYFLSLITFMFSFATYADIDYGYGFVTIADSNLKKIDEVPSEALKMPRVRVASEILRCGPVTASYLLDYNYCQESEIPNCSQTTDDQRCSLADLAKLGVPKSELLKHNEDPSSRDSYKEILQKPIAASLITYNGAFSVQTIAKESCAPFDQYLDKFKSPDQQAEMAEKMATKLKMAYETYWAKQGKCNQCDLDLYATTTGRELKSDYNLKIDDVTALKAFASKTYGEFLAQLTVPKECENPRNQIDVAATGKTMDYFPKYNSERDYDHAIAKLKKILQKNQPVGLQNICLEKNYSRTDRDIYNPKCKDQHAVAVTGYRRLCSIENPNKCIDEIKVLNSWGKSWQDQNNDGWVDAKEIFERTRYVDVSMFWIQKKGQE